MSSFYQKKTAEQSNLREFNVGAPDEFNSHTQPMPVIQQVAQRDVGYELSAAEREELQRHRRQADKQGPKMGDHAKKRVEILANIGRLTKDVEVEGITFGLRTLKTKETRDATMSIFECKNDADAAFEIRRQTLARAINQIDGQEIELALGSDDFALKLSLIDDMEDTIVTKLYNSFNELRQEVRVKYGLETEAQAKEVVEDIKKS